MAVLIKNIVYYPIKGIGGTSVEKTQLTPQGIRHDRHYAITFAQPPTAIPEKWRPWDYCHSLKKTELLARLSASATNDPQPTLHIYFDQQLAVSGRPDIPNERQQIETCLREILNSPTMHFIDSIDRPLWDEDNMPLTLLNEDSVESLASLTNTSLQNARFRANIVFSGLAPWQEEKLNGRVQIGDACLLLAGGVPRCAATTVNPDTAERDIKVPQLLVQHRTHNEMGVFAKILRSGEISVGQELYFESP